VSLIRITKSKQLALHSNAIDTESKISFRNSEKRKVTLGGGGGMAEGKYSLSSYWKINSKSGEFHNPRKHLKLAQFLEVLCLSLVHYQPITI